MVHDVEERCNLLRIKKDKSAFWGIPWLCQYHICEKRHILYMFFVTFLSQRMLFRFVSDHGGAMIVVSRKFLFFDTFSIEKT